MKLDTRKHSTVGGSVLAALVLLMAALVQVTLVVPPALADSCPNAAERFGASANLPDCRAYELVTQPIKEDNSNLFSAYGFADGEHIVYDGIAPFPGAANGAISPTLSWRTSTGWATRTLTPPQGPGESNTLNSPDQGDEMMSTAFTGDFSAAFVASTFASDPFDQNENMDIYRVDTASGASSLASRPDSGPMTAGIYNPPGGNVGYTPGSFLAGASSDGSRVFFTDTASIPTAPGTPSDTQSVGFELYERHDGHTYLVSLLPDGSVPTCGAEVGQGGLNSRDYYRYYIYGAVSPDGSNVVFHTPAEVNLGEDAGCKPLSSYPSEEGALYLRESNGTPQARTVKLPGIVYLGRSADATKIFSGGDLEGNAEGGPLYEYDIATGQTVKIGTGDFLTASTDGSVVYYLRNSREKGSAGGPNQRLMVYDKGVTKEIPGAGPGYAGKMMVNGLNLLGVVSLENLPVATPDGSKLLFVDRGILTSYNSAGPACKALNEGHFGSGAYLPQDCDEAYIYDLATSSFTCVSCNPDGTPPSHGTDLFIPPGFNIFTPQTTYSLTEDSSRAFFETANPLVPQDTNGQTDVYEWEGGHIFLLSSGQGSQGSRLDGVSHNGDDVFLQSSDQLLPQDVESSTQIYDVRVDGGFPYTQPVYGCNSGQCQGPQTPAPAFSAPASATFVGLGNPPAESVAAVPKPKSKPKKRSGHRHRARHAARKRRVNRGPSNRKPKGRK